MNMEEQESKTKKSVRRRKDDYGFISFLIDIETNASFDEFLNQRHSGITKFLTESIEVALKTGLMPGELSNNSQSENNSDFAEKLTATVDSLHNDIESCKTQIGNLSDRVDLMIKLLASSK